MEMPRGYEITGALGSKYGRGRGQPASGEEQSQGRSLEKGGGQGCKGQWVGRHRGSGREAPGTFMSLWKSVLVTSYLQLFDLR